MATNRGYVYQSGDKDRIIDYLERCEKRMLEQFAEIRKLASEIADINLRSPLNSAGGHNRIEATTSIIELCDVYLDKRSDKRKMQSEIDELKGQMEILTGLLEDVRGVKNDDLG